MINGVLVVPIYLNGVILYELLKGIQQKVIKAVLPVIEGRKSKDRLGILRESLLADTKAGYQARIQEKQDYQDVESQLKFFF
jgi:hypothetical protein